MDKKSKQHLENDIENQLDRFFAEAQKTGKPPRPAAPLEKLKSVVLSIDWEITDRCLSELVSETNAMMPLVQADRYVQALLRMLNALGRYLQKHKAQAHPDAIRRIMSAFDALEQLLAGNSTDEHKRRLLAREISAFKKLKTVVTGSGPLSVNESLKSTATESGNMDILEEKMKAVDKLSREIDVIKSQLAVFQHELTRLRSKK